MTTDKGLLPVEQRHRDAAAQSSERLGFKLRAEQIRRGEADFAERVQDFARFERDLLSTRTPSKETEGVGWRPISSAPKDGTTIDVWRDSSRETVYWGLPPHECGEMGQYCDSDWHGLKKPGWICSTFGEYIGGKHDPFTHWQPLPPTPGASPPAPAEAIREEVLAEVEKVLAQTPRPELATETCEMFAADAMLRKAIRAVQALRQPTPRGDDGEEG